MTDFYGRPIKVNHAEIFGLMCEQVERDPTTVIFTFSTGLICDLTWMTRVQLMQDASFSLATRSGIVTALECGTKLCLVNIDTKQVFVFPKARFLEQWRPQGPASSAIVIDFESGDED